MRVEAERRVDIGRRAAAARRGVGYKRQEKFASAIGVSEASVANFERGAPSVGDGTFNAVERGLDWTPGAIRHYIETGDESLLPPEIRRPGATLAADPDAEKAAERAAAIAATEEKIKGILAAIGTAHGRDVQLMAAARLGEIIREEMARLSEKDASDIT